MPLFEQFPYTNFHELNLDQALKYIRQAIDAAAKNTQDVAAVVEDMAVFKQEIYDYLNTLDIPAQIQAVIDEMASSGELDAYIQAAILKLVSTVDHLILNKIGTEFVDDASEAYSGAQGSAITPDNNLAIFYADYKNQTRNGRIRIVGLDNNTTVREQVVQNVGHGQSMAIKDGNIFLLDFVTTLQGQNISVVDLTTLQVSATITPAFDGTQFVIAAIYTDPEDNELYALGSNIYNNIDYKAHLVYSSGAITVTDIATIDHVSRSSTDGFLCARAFKDYIIAGLTGDFCLAVYNKLSGTLVKIIELPKMTSNSFILGELESFDLDEDGNIYMIFDEINARGIWLTIGSGWYMNTRVKGNILTNAAPDDDYNTSKLDTSFRPGFHVSPANGSFGASGVLGDPFASFWEAMLYRGNNGMNITIDDATILENMTFVGNHDLTIYANNLLTVSGTVELRYCDKVEFNDFAPAADVKLIECSDVQFYNSSLADLSLVKSFIKTYATAVTSITADYLSNIETATTFDHAIFQNAIPDGVKWHIANAAPAVADNLIDTGLTVNRLQSANRAIGLWINAGSNYLRVIIPTMSFSYMTLIWGYGSNVGTVTLQIANNKLYIQAITGGSLTLADISRFELWSL